MQPAACSLQDGFLPSWPLRHLLSCTLCLRALVHTASLAPYAPSTSSTWENPSHPSDPGSRHFPNRHVPSAFCSGGNCPAYRDPQYSPGTPLTSALLCLAAPGGCVLWEVATVWCPHLQSEDENARIPRRDWGRSKQTRKRSWLCRHNRCSRSAAAAFNVSRRSKTQAKLVSSFHSSDTASTHRTQNSALPPHASGAVPPQAGSLWALNLVMAASEC